VSHHLRPALSISVALQEGGGRNTIAVTASTAIVIAKRDIEETQINIRYFRSGTFAPIRKMPIETKPT